MSTKNFPSTDDPTAYKPEYNIHVAPKSDKSQTKTPEADPLAYKPEYNLLVKKKDGGNISSDGGSKSPSVSAPAGNIAAPPVAAPVDENGLTPMQNKAFQAASSGPKISDLYAKTYDLLNKSIPQSSDPNINAQRSELITKVKNGDQASIISAKQFIKTGIQKQIEQIKQQSFIAGQTGGRVIAAPVFSPSPDQKKQLDVLQKSQDEVEDTLNDYAVNAAANSKEMQAQVRAEVSGKQYGASPNLAMEDLGKQIEKIYGGLPNPNGNIQYERQRAGAGAIINNKQMKINDLIAQGMKSKNQTMLQQADKEKQELEYYQGKYDNLTDNFPDVAITQVSRYIGDELAETHPRNMIISKSDVLESADRIEKNHPGFIAKFGKYINTVAESEGEGFFGKFKSGLVPKGGVPGAFLGALEAGTIDTYLDFRSMTSKGAEFIDKTIGNTDAAEHDRQIQREIDIEKADPSIQGTKQSHTTRTNIVLDDNGKAFKEQADQYYGKHDWNSSMRFLGSAIPGLAAWIAPETAGAKVAEAVGAGKGVASTIGLIAASAYTGYDSNYKLAESLIDDNSSLGTAKKAVFATGTTLLTACAFKLIGYSPTKFVEDAFSKSIAPDVVKAFEESGWKQLPKSKMQDLMINSIIPKAKTFAVEAAKSAGMGGKVAAATIADQKVKDFVSVLLNPEKAEPSTLDDNIKTFTEQALFMTLVGLPKAVVSGITSPSGKDALYDIGVRGPQYIEQINNKLSNGEYTQDEANKAIAATKTMTEEVAKVQNQTTKDGLPLTVGQKKEIAVQNFRKRAAQQMKDGGMDISAEKINHDADDQIKNTKSENTHLPLEETEAFKTAVEVDSEGKEIGKPKDVDDIEPESKYTYSKNGRETTTTGLELQAHLPQSEKYEEPVIEDPKITEGEVKKTTLPEGQSTESEIKPEDKILAAKTELKKAVDSKEGLGTYGDLLKSDPSQSEGVIKEIAYQAQGVDEDGLPLKGGPREESMKMYYPPELVDAAKEAFPIPELPELRTDEEASKIINEKLSKEQTREARKFDTFNLREKVKKLEAAINCL